NGLLQRIDLSGLNISNLPEDFDRRFPYIQHLNLENNEFAKLPSCLQNLPFLDGIWLRGNPLKEIDLDTIEWPKLRYFSIDSNVPLFVDTWETGYDYDPKRKPIDHNLDLRSISHPQKYPSIFGKLFHSQIFARPIDRYITPLLNNSLDPKYYDRFATEISASIRIYLRERLPSNHVLISLMDWETSISLNEEYDLKL
ncbi:MAG: hypothetical protein ACTSRK_04710, partial [Promethearchaeota archaeon]